MSGKILEKVFAAVVSVAGLAIEFGFMWKDYKKNEEARAKLAQLTPENVAKEIWKQDKREKKE